MSAHGSHQPHSQHGLPIRTVHVVVGLVALRLLNTACTDRTFFQPDEYFQALEPAWNLAFGPNSGAWLTWEWAYQLRSSLHPALFALTYAVVDRLTNNTLLSLPPSSQAAALLLAPKLVQAGLAALGDLYTWKLANKVYGQGSKSAWSALCITVLNPWQWYCATRTFSNTLEMTLTIAALNFWPWELHGDASEAYGGFSARRERLNSLRLSLFLAALAVLLRPTNLLIWATIVATALTRLTLRGRSPINLRIVLVLFREAVLCGSAALALSGLSDRLYFGEWTFPPYQTLYFNLSRDIAVFYGEMDWHYYLSQGITQLTMTFLPFALFGLYKATTSHNPAATALQSNTLRTLALAVIATITALSVISHKEVRFIYPLIPILHILAAPSFAAFFTSPPGRQPSQLKTALLAGLLFVNLVIAVYLSLFHTSAAISVMHFLRRNYERIHPDRLDLHPRVPVTNHYHTLSNNAPAEAAAAANDELFALFLTPCHATPWRSHLVYPSLRARALTCEPPVHTAPRSAERATYKDETKRFFEGFGMQDPWGLSFLANEVWPKTSSPDSGGDYSAHGGKRAEIPRYIVGFESIEGTLRAFFDQQQGKLGGDDDDAAKDTRVQLRKVWSAWNGLFSDDERKEGRLCVWDTGVFPEPVPLGGGEQQLSLNEAL